MSFKNYEDLLPFEYCRSNKLFNGEATFGRRSTTFEKNIDRVLTRTRSVLICYQ